MEPDQDLLRQFAATRDEGAFAELVRRYVDLVYATAVRLLNGDTHLAQDVTQAVFTDLAREGAAWRERGTVAGWLHTSARFHASKTVRTERRRRAREQEAMAMSEQNSTAEISWEVLRPLLDEAVGALSEEDRDAVLLRYFQGKSHREVGSQLGVDENTARMRGARALEKLRDYFGRNGMKTSAMLLASTLGAQAMGTPAPAAFAAGLAGHSLAGAAGGSAAGGWASAMAQLLGGSKARAGISGAVALAAVLGIFWNFRNETAKPDKTAPLVVAKPAASNPVATLSSNSTNPMTTSQNLRGAVAAVLVASAPVAAAQNSTPTPAAPMAAAPAATPAANPVVVAAIPVDSLARYNSQFALDLYHQFNPATNENAFFSPYSVSTALAMTLTGARGETATQMAKVLHLAPVAAADVPPSFGLLQQALADAQVKTGVRLAIANALFPEANPEHAFLPDFVNSAKNNFDAAVFPLDYRKQPADAADRINAWVAEKTKDKIKDVVKYPDDINASTRLALVNAIYFKGAWATPFQERASRSEPFTLADGSAKTVMLMHGTLQVRYAEVANGPTPCQIISLNYYGDDPETNGSGGTSQPATQRGRGFGPRGGELSFIAILPRANDGLVALEKTLTAEQLAEWLGRLTLARVEVFLPKFKIKQHYQLAETLQAMGMTQAFINGAGGGSPGADFSGMNGARDLFISKVIHQTFVEVDEKGTEAAAATVVSMARGSAPSAPLAVFRADHPFLFLIRDNTTGSILFLGRLANPE